MPALLATLMAMILIGALASALALQTAAELRIASQAKAAAEAIYAAQAAAELALDDLARISDLDAVLAGTVTSRLREGSAAAEARDRPPWKLFGYGRLRDLMRLESINTDTYVVIWVARPPGGGAGAMTVLAQAHGLGDTLRVVEVQAERVGGGIARRSWREVR
jgi:hypothetical protein